MAECAQLVHIYRESGLYRWAVVALAIAVWGLLAVLLFAMGAAVHDWWEDRHG